MSSERIRELALGYGTEDQITKHVIVWIVPKPDGMHAIFHTAGALTYQSKLVGDLVNDKKFMDQLCDADRNWLVEEAGKSLRHRGRSSGAGAIGAAR